MLVLEDVFLADRESQRLFESLIPRLQELPILICVSYRPDFEHQWAQAAWFAEHLVEPLPDGEMLALARALLGDDPSVQASQANWSIAPTAIRSSWSSWSSR